MYTFVIIETQLRIHMCVNLLCVDVCTYAFVEAQGPRTAVRMYLRLQAQSVMSVTRVSQEL